MSSICISNCVDDDCRIPARATYKNMYKWPESDEVFVRSVSSKGRLLHDDPTAEPPFVSSVTTNQRRHPRVVDSMSCRQLFLRSYPFSRKESMPQKAKKCVGRVREKMKKVGGGGRAVVKCAKEASCATFEVIFRRLLSCTTKVDVVG